MSEERDIITTSTPPGFDSLARPKMMHQRSDFESPRSNLTNNQQQKRAPSFNDDDIAEDRIVDITENSDHNSRTDFLSNSEDLILQNLRPEDAPSLLSLQVTHDRTTDRGCDGLTIAYQWCEEEGMDISSSTSDSDECNPAGTTPLHLAIEAERLDLLRSMVLNITDVDQRNSSGSTLLHSAAATRNIHICKLLLEHNADPDVIDCNGMTPLHMCQSTSGGVKVARMLLGRTPDLINRTDKFGKTALYMACERGNKAMVDFLLTEALALPNIAGPAKRTPLLTAINSHYQPLRKFYIIELLLKHGANPNIPDEDGKTAFTTSTDIGLFSDEVKKRLLWASLTQANSAASSLTMSSTNNSSYYASSIFSETRTESTNNLNSSWSDILIVRDEIADFLLRDNGIRSLIEWAIRDPKIGAQRLETNFRRLLIGYSKDLLSQASIPIHEEAARFIKRHSSFIVNAAYPVALNSGNMILSDQPEETNYQSTTKHRIVQGFLKSLPTLNTTHQEDFNSFHSISHGRSIDEDFSRDYGCESISSGSISDDESDSTILDGDKSIMNAISEVKEFLQRGSPMANLKAKLQSLLQTSPGAARFESSYTVRDGTTNASQMTSIAASRDVISYDNEKPEAQANIEGDKKLAEPRKAKGTWRIYDTKANLDQLEAGNSRNQLILNQNVTQISTTQSQYEQLPEGLNNLARAQVCLVTLPQILDSVVERIPFLYHEPPLAAGRTRVRWTCRCGMKLFDDFIELESGSLHGFQESLHQLNQDEKSGKAEKYIHNTQGTQSKSPSRIIGWLSQKVSGIVSRTKSILPSQGNASTASATSPSLPLHSILHLLFCIHTGEVGLRLRQERLAGINSDRELLRFLRNAYSKSRNISSWLTLRNVTAVSLARFAVDSSAYADVHHHTQACAQECICLPSVDRIGTEYNCRPAPGIKPKYVPAIGPRYLTHHFTHPDCVRPSQQFIYNQLPKRKCGRLLASEDQVEFGWGIYFEEGWHWRSIYFVIVVLIASGSAVFGITWSVTKGDIQGGFAISSAWITLGSLLLGYVAVRSF